MCVMILALLFSHPVVQGQVKPQVIYSGNIKSESEIGNFLSQGVHNFELDVMPIYGELYVTAIMPDSANHSKPTLRKAYLLPLFNQINGKENPEHFGSEVKSYLILNMVFGSPQVYKILRSQLSPIHDVLTYKLNDSWHLGALQVAVKDEVLKSRIHDAKRVLTGVIGNLNDRDSTFDENTMPFIEVKFSEMTSWNGLGNIPFEEYLSLKNLAADIHRKGKKICISDCPKTDEAWDVLIKAKVDFISTVDAIELQKFINKQPIKE